MVSEWLTWKEEEKLILMVDMRERRRSVDVDVGHLLIK